ncbi:Glycosyltransferase [Hordeum vulgare]|uniref:Glycosyltransferase n=1 Tax=Hordeum vulgare subsp. vulgare TaxID=112509 RepID=A0A8I6YQT2_HORVV|nr:crocetin glucosyltransferase, chloroplastic-like [Hordeum vulgare subsp. vulgare]KAE8809832.1 Glycosyltransferase [Hordeum vulgare]
MSPQRHFLVLTFPLQGHIAPALRLARRLLAAAPDALVTFSTTEAAHRRMFPAEPDGGVDDCRLELLPFSDGTDAGYDRSSTDPAAFTDYMASFQAAGARSVGELVDALAARGRPVTRVVYTMLLPWAADVAREKGLPSALYWIQPAAVLAVYYHYFHGYAAVVADHRHDPSFVVRFPGLPPQAVRDLPSFITDSTDPSEFFHSVYTTVRDLFESLDRESPRATVLVNTCQELEEGALAAVRAYDALPIGPVLPSGDEAGLFKQDSAKYMEWLDAKPVDSVVYVAFGSLTGMAREQLDELLLGLEESGRPYLFIVRKDIKAELADAVETDAWPKNGVVVEWCDQVRVLSHAAVGCFVTHCGWNSVMESMACGVPMVCVPQMSDQRMNAWLVEFEWRVGARAEVGGDGVLRAVEVRQRLEEVTQDGEAGAGGARGTASEWKRVVAEALGKDGSSDRNLRAFVEGIISSVSL